MPIPQREPPEQATPAGDRLGYFMVKVRRTSSEPPGDFSGVVERLGTGEKREFKSCDELTRLVDEWSR